MRLVVKLSGKVLDDRAPREELCRQLALLVRENHQIVIVHGGGKQLNNLCLKLGIPVVQYEGRRVTDDATLKAAEMAFSAVNCDLVAGLTAQGIQALGLRAFDARITQCHRRAAIPVDVDGEIREVDFGWVGEIDHVSGEVLEQLWSLELLPVISCLCADSTGQVMNINADTLAAELSVATDAERLLSLSDVAGVYLDLDDPNSLIAGMTADQARRYLEEGRFTGGMMPKISMVLNALERGVPAVQILSGLTPNALPRALAGQTGTLIQA